MNGGVEHHNEECRELSRTQSGSEAWFPEGPPIILIVVSYGERSPTLANATERHG